MKSTTVAVDLAKSVFQLAVSDASWKVTETGKQLQHVIDELAIEEGEWLELSGEIEVLEAAGA